MPSFDYSKSQIKKAIGQNHPTSTDNAIARYNGVTGKLQNSLAKVADNGRLQLTNGIENKGDLILASNNQYLAAYHPQAARYGYFAGYNGAGDRGFYFGYGNGGSTINLALDTATQVDIIGGKMTFGSDAWQLATGGGIGKIIKSDELGNASWADAIVPLGTFGQRGAATRVLEWFNNVAPPANSYLHIDTGLDTATMSRMFLFHLQGYPYGATSIYDVKYAGYCYSASGVIHNKKISQRNDTAEVTDTLIYKGSNGHVYLRFKVNNFYYSTFWLDSYVVGNGTVFPPSQFSATYDVAATL